MKIKEVIRIFGLVAQDYRLAIQRDWDYDFIEHHTRLNHGICVASRFYGNNISSIFNNQGYYKNYINNITNYLCITPFLIKNKEYSNIVEKCFKPRLEFLETEIKSLNKLLKKGYKEI